MKPISIFVTLCLFTFSQVTAQDKKTRLPGKPTEQTEIIADRHLETEMKKNQLNAKPELLGEIKSKKETIKSERKNDSFKKDRNRKCKSNKG